MIARRGVLQGIGAGIGALALPSLVRGQAAAHVVVVGGGFGGATTARYLRRLSPGLRITLVEPNERFITCPFSNLYLGGLRDWDSLGHGFDDLRAQGIEVIHARAEDVDTAARTVTLSDGTRLDWDRLVLSPGIDFRWNGIEGYDEAAAELAPHAWKAGPQTQLLHDLLRAMEDGGTFAMVVPQGAFRCPPGPYERASMVAHYLKTHKPRSKILILDSQDKFSKQALFQQGWDALYPGMIEWVSLSDDGLVVQVDAAAREAVTGFGTVHKANVLNVIPPQKAGLIAERAGVTDDTGWAPVNGDRFESALVSGIFVLGDATIAAPMPKSGFAANTQGKVAAAVIAAELAGREAPPASYANTCYSLIGPGYGISVAGVYRGEGGKIVEIEGSGGVSPLDAGATFHQAEADYGAGWYAAITADIWGNAGVNAIALGLILGAVFGAAARTGRFCLLRGMKGLVPGKAARDLSALRAFALAIAVALVGTQALNLSGGTDLQAALPLRAGGPWLAMLIGGAIFGLGMVLANSCGARALVLLAGGNLRSLMVLLCLGLAAQATLTGVLAPARSAVQQFGQAGLAGLSLPQLIAGAGMSPRAALAIATILPALALIAFAWPLIRRRPVEAAMAAIIGATVVGGWWITFATDDPFDPKALTSLSYVGPMGESVLWLMLSTGRQPAFGVAIIGGTLIGAFATALLTRSLRAESFGAAAQTAASALGGALMGFGGVLALGCSIGQGLSGLSTLSVASLIAFVGILAGTALGLTILPRPAFTERT